MKSRIINRTTYIEQYVVRAIVLIMEQVKHIDKQTADGTAQNLEALYKLFPSCFTETEDVEGKVKHAINWEKLRELLTSSIFVN